MVDQVGSLAEALGGVGKYDELAIRAGGADLIVVSQGREHFHAMFLTPPESARAALVGAGFARDERWNIWRRDVRGLLPGRSGRRMAEAIVRALREGYAVPEYLMLDLEVSSLLDEDEDEDEDDDPPD